MIIKDDIVDDTSRRTFDGANDCQYVVVHETANKKDGATAAMHARYQKMYPMGSWHLQADDIEVIRSYPDSARCWHAGDGRGPGNMSGLAIEICVNLDEQPEKQLDAYRNAAEAVAMWVVKHNIPLSRVVQHNKFSTWGKDCPDLLRAAKFWSWEDFIAAVAQYAKVTEPKPKPPVVKPPVPSEHLDEDGWWGRDTTSETQEALGTPADGEVWNQNVRWEDDNPALTSGWKWVDPEDTKNGSKMVHAIWAFLVKQGVSKRLLGPDDGLIGPGHIKGIQTWLKWEGLYSGPIDGRLDKKSPTVKGWQRALNRGLVKK